MIKLTLPNGNPIHINPDYVIAVRQDDASTGAAMVLDDGARTVVIVREESSVVASLIQAYKNS